MTNSRQKIEFTRFSLKKKKKEEISRGGAVYQYLPTRFLAAAKDRGYTGQSSEASFKIAFVRVGEMTTSKTEKERKMMGSSTISLRNRTICLRDGVNI